MVHLGCSTTHGRAKQSSFHTEFLNSIRLSPLLVQLLSSKIVHFDDKSMELCRITTIPKTNIFWYGSS